MQYKLKTKEMALELDLEQHERIREIGAPKLRLTPILGCVLVWLLFALQAVIRCDAFLFLDKAILSEAQWRQSRARISAPFSHQTTVRMSKHRVNGAHHDSNGMNGKHQQDHHSCNIPKHVALICDGNSRWAEARGWPASVGHFEGANRLIDILHSLQKMQGIEYCTFYGFSTENWKRPQREIDDILGVMEHTAINFYQKAIDENVRVKILGDLHDERIPQSLRGVLQKLENDTVMNGKLTVCIAINYGGRQDIANASLQMTKAIVAGQLSPDEVTPDTFESYLCTSGIPHPDLLIRTGGEQRLSNFLLWNCAYSELHFSEVLWPDFDQECLVDAIDWFSTRSRRFGGRKEEQAPAISSNTAK